MWRRIICFESQIYELPAMLWRVYTVPASWISGARISGNAGAIAYRSKLTGKFHAGVLPPDSPELFQRGALVDQPCWYSQRFFESKRGEGPNGQWDFAERIMQSA